MTDGLYFRVLGPVAAERDGEPLDLGGAQRRTVLAVLLLNLGRVVPADRLVDALWGERPPVSHRVQLQGIVSDLRRALGPGGRRDAAPIETRPPGYLLRVRPEQVDLEEFRADLDAARDAGPGGAASVLRGALARWRGAAFTGVSAAEVHDAAVAVDQLRLAALEDRVEAELALGGGPELIADLRALVDAHPDRERFRGQLMAALARGGRTADALAVYREGRTWFRDELGVEPSAELQRLHQEILAEPPQQAGVAPRQLPRDVPHLVGRDALLRRAAALVLGTPAARLAVTGPGGVGKTAFALRLAHRLADAFPDGQLYARGGDVPARFLRGLGLRPERVPEDLDERASVLRDLLADRRVLMVVDDVAGEEQIGPLLPASAGCALLVTSRRRLSGIDGLATVPLRVLDAAAGAALLCRVLPDGRAAAEPVAAAEIVRQCGGLPLALRIVAARLASRPDWTVGDMAGRLAVRRERLDWLQAGNLEVRASLAETYEALTCEQRRLLRLLAQAGEGDFPDWVPALLLEAEHGQAGRLLEELVDVHLVEPAGRGVTGARYRVHALVQLFAGERAEAEDDPLVRQAARDRVMDGWYDLARAADDSLPHWYGLDPEPPPAHRAPPGPRGRAGARAAAWFDEEAGTLLGVVWEAAERGRNAVAWPLAQRLSTHLDLRGRYVEWAAVLREGLRVAEAAGDRRGVACMLGLMLDVASVSDRVEVAHTWAERAVMAYMDLDAPARSRPPGGHVSHPATLELERSLALARAQGDLLAVGMNAFELARARRHAGVRAGYLELFEEAGAAFRAVGAKLSELWTIKSVGLAHLKAGRLEEALGYLVRGREVAATLPADDWALLLGDIPMVYAAHGRFAEATVLAMDGLRESLAHRHRWDEARATTTLAEIARARGDRVSAAGWYDRAAGLWQDLAAGPYLERTLDRLGELLARQP